MHYQLVRDVLFGIMFVGTVPLTAQEVVRVAQVEG
jgi:hypothetical protein